MIQNFLPGIFGLLAADLVAKVKEHEYEHVRHIVKTSVQVINCKQKSVKMLTVSYLHKDNFDSGNITLKL